MKRLERYLLSHLLLGHLLALLTLLLLFGLVDLVDQLSEIGEGRYRFGDALLYVASGLPMRAVSLSPVALLVGGLLGLLPLVQNSEIVAMRACGFGDDRLRRTLLIAALLLGAGLWLWLELIAAPLAQFGHLDRQAKLTREGRHLGRSGLWSRDLLPGGGQIYFHLAPGDGGIGALTLYRFDGSGRLLEVVWAEGVEPDGGRWRLSGSARRVWKEGFLVPAPPLPHLPPLLPEEELDRLQLPPETLSLSELWQRIRRFRKSGLEGELYELALGDHLLKPLQLAAMALMLLPPLLMTPRAARRNLLAGAALLFGTLYFLGSRLLQKLGLLYGLPAWLAAPLPTALLWVLAWLWNRSRSAG